VASKQLVTHSVVSVPARFLSYQQVICSVPELDIHSPDEIKNFDLSDNTDHTRSEILQINGHYKSSY
jgi:hypothetical protein